MHKNRYSCFLKGCATSDTVLNQSSCAEMHHSSTSARPDLRHSSEIQHFTDKQVVTTPDIAVISASISKSVKQRISIVHDET